MFIHKTLAIIILIILCSVDHGYLHCNITSYHYIIVEILHINSII